MTIEENVKKLLGKTDEIYSLVEKLWKEQGLSDDAKKILALIDENLSDIHDMDWGIDVE